MIEDRVITLIAEADPARRFVVPDSGMQRRVHDRVMDAVAATDGDEHLELFCSDPGLGGGRWLRRRVSIAAVFALSVIAAVVAVGAFAVIARARVRPDGGSARIGATRSHHGRLVGDEAELLYEPAVAFLRSTTRRQSALARSGSRAAAGRLGSRQVRLRSRLARRCLVEVSRVRGAELWANARSRSDLAIDLLARAQLAQLANLPAGIG